MVANRHIYVVNQLNASHGFASECLIPVGFPRLLSATLPKITELSFVAVLKMGEYYRSPNPSSIEQVGSRYCWVISTRVRASSRRPRLELDR